MYFPRYVLEYNEYHIRKGDNMKKFFKFAASAAALAAGVASVVYLVKDRINQDDLADEFDDDFDDDFDDLEDSPSTDGDVKAAPQPQPAIKGFRATTRDN